MWREHVEVRPRRAYSFPHSYAESISYERPDLSQR